MKAVNVVLKLLKVDSVYSRYLQAQTLKFPEAFQQSALDHSYLSPENLISSNDVFLTETIVHIRFDLRFQGTVIVAFKDKERNLKDRVPVSQSRFPK